MEKIQHHVFADFVDLLQQHRGKVLTTMSETLSEKIYDMLLGRDTNLSFNLESVHQKKLIEIPYDSPALVRSCQRV